MFRFSLAFLHSFLLNYKVGFLWNEDFQERREIDLSKVYALLWGNNFQDAYYEEKEE